MTTKTSTQSVKTVRQAKLQLWWNSLKWHDEYLDRSLKEEHHKEEYYSYWVQEKYQCLDCPKVAAKVLGAKNHDMFKGSSWGVDIRDAFNEKYAALLAGEASFVAKVAAEGQYELPIGTGEPDAFLDRFLEEFLGSSNDLPTEASGEKNLKALLTSLVNVSVGRYKVKIGKQQEEIADLKRRVQRKDKKLLDLKEEIELIKTREEEDNHNTGSYRNNYFYDIDEG